MFKILSPPEIMIFFFFQNFKSYFIVILNYWKLLKFLQFLEPYKF
jgi:hypothetical protein